MIKRKCIAVLGMGALGTAVCKTYHNNDYEVHASDTHGDTHSDIHSTAIGEVSYVIVCIAAKDIERSVRLFLPTIAKLHSNVAFVSCAKGVCSDGQYPYKRIEYVLREHGFGNPVGVLVGPNIANEIQEGKPTMSIVAFDDMDTTTRACSYLSLPHWRLLPSDQVEQTQRVAIIKNSLSITLGAASTIGKNFASHVFSRCLQDLNNIFGIEATLSVACVGDLVLSLLGTRNFTLGVKLGNCTPLNEADKNLEGYLSTMMLASEPNIPSAVSIANELIQGANAEKVFRDYEYLP